VAEENIIGLKKTGKFFQAFVAEILACDPFSAIRPKIISDRHPANRGPRAMRTGRRHFHGGDQDGEEAGADYEATGYVGANRRETGDAPELTSSYVRRMAKRRAIAELTRLRWKVTDIALAVDLAPSHVRYLIRSNRAVAEAAGRV
jgi:hypothetical protein